MMLNRQYKPTLTPLEHTFNNRPCLLKHLTFPLHYYIASVIYNWWIQLIKKQFKFLEL